MPEAYILPTAADIKRKSSIVPSGIGDSDGFPLFDNGGDDDAYSTPEDRKWGFRITGGAEFKMPITVFQVTEGSLAAKGGIKLGDIILKINEIETKNLSLAQAHEIVEQAESNLHLIAKKMEDENDTGAHIEEISVVLRQPIELQNIQPPRELVIPQAERKVWHPVMWNHPPPAANEEVQEELPHHRIIRNIKRFFKDTEGKPETRQKYVEDMLLALPGASKLE